MASSILIPHNQNTASSNSTNKIKNRKINHFGTAVAALPAKKIKWSVRLRTAKPQINNVFPARQVQQSTNDTTSKSSAPKFHLSNIPPLNNGQYCEAKSLETNLKDKHVEMFMRGLSHSRRWIFHLYNRFHVKANYNNLLQVKLNQHTPIVEWVYKILQAGQCAAIMLENNGICRTNLQAIKALCQSANVALVIIEGRSEKLN